MAHLDIEAGKKAVVKGLWLLGIVTLLEVFIALIGNGHIIDGFHLPKLLMYPAMIALSLYKAYFIIFEFMHMKYEVKGMVRSVLLPATLLIWAIIAFMSEGNYWGVRRAQIKEFNERPATEVKMEKQEIKN